MKGVSIAIETIIYIIIAVMVMTVLLFFFTSQAGPAQTQFQLEQQRTTLCGQYQQKDSACTGDGHGNGKGDATLISNLVKTCTSIGVNYCGTSEQLKCIQSCCLTCPVKPTS